jgi:hypothetical protein
MSDAPDPNTSLRLADAVKLAFPLGGLTVSGLRREAARGRLVIERIAGKDFVTLAAVEAMRELCRLKPVASTPKVQPQTQSPAKAALLARLERRKAEHAAP